jgi:hypothetical protein
MDGATGLQIRQARQVLWREAALVNALPRLSPTKAHQEGSKKKARREPGFEPVFTGTAA